MIPSTKPPTEADRERQIDELVAKSRSWRALAVALSKALAPYPEAARSVVAALREVDL